MLETKPDVAFKLLEKYGATVGLYPPTALKVLREIKNPRDKYKLKLRCIVSGAEPVTTDSMAFRLYDRAFGCLDRATIRVGTPVRKVIR